LVQQPSRSKSSSSSQVDSSIESPPQTQNPDSALQGLEELHAMSQGVEISEFAPIVAQTSIALVKAALAATTTSDDDSTLKEISNLFANSFEQYLGTKNSRTKVQPLLTNEFCKRTPLAAWGMFERIVKLARGQVEGDKKSSVNAFRRMQAFEVAQTLLVSYTNLVSVFFSFSLFRRSENIKTKTSRLC
jgi:DNA polymerase phi